MTVIINGTNGITSVNGTAAAPSVTGTDTDTGLVYGTNTVTIATGGTAGLVQNSVQGVQIANTLGVGGATPSTSGAGITFPAAQSDSSNANTLDDYEEGTWTPTVTSGTIVPLRPRYTKVGRLVTVSAYVGTFSDTSSSNTVEIGGLPFPTGDVEGVGSFFARYVTSAICATYAGSGGGTLLRFYNTSSGAFSPLLHNQFNSASAQIYFEVTYAA